MKIAIIQQHNNVSRIDNQRRLEEKITAMSTGGAQLVVLQELHDDIYFCQTEDVSNFDLSVTIPGKATDLYARLAKDNHMVIVGSFFERRAPGLYHNTAVAFDADGSIAGIYRKMHIPDDPGYYEKFYFAPGDLGFRPIDTSIGRLGVLVCWDQWFPEAARLMTLAGAEILIYPTAIGYDARDDDDERQRQRQAWQVVQRGHAVANGLPVVTVNRVGQEAASDGDGIFFWGSSFVAGPQGEILAELSSTDEQELIVDVDMRRVEQVRRWWPFLRDRRVDAYGGITALLLSNGRL